MKKINERLLTRYKNEYIMKSAYMKITKSLAVSVSLSISCLWDINPCLAIEKMAWQDCVREAAKNNPQLISAEEVIKSKQALETSSASGLYPQITGDMSAQRAQAASASNTTGVKHTISNTYSYGVSGTQLIFDGFKTYNDVRAASADLKAAKEAYLFTSSAVRLSLRTAFINLLKAQEMINVAEDIVKIRHDNLELIKLRYQSGLEHKGALMTAEANLAQAEYELAKAKRDVVFAQRQLTKEMGRKAFRPMSADGDFVVIDAAPEKPDLDKIAEKTPAVLQAGAATKSAYMSVQSAVGDFMPVIEGTIGADKANVNSNWPPKGNEWNLGVSVSMPFFDGGELVSGYANAKAAYRKAQEDERNTRDAAVVSLEETWTALQDAMDIVGVSRKSLEATKERSRIAQVQYSTGFMSFDNWIIIEDDLVQAKNTYLNARANALLAEASWIKAKGETVEYAY